MTTWNVTYHCKPGQREAFFQALSDLRVHEVSINEAGNKKYDYFFSAHNADDLLLVETWTDTDLQQAHCQAETFAKLQELKAEYCESVSVDKFYY